MTKTLAQLEQSEFSYQGTFSTPLFSLLDAPGKLYDLLLRALGPLGATASDLFLEEGEPCERGVGCEVDHPNLSVVIRGERLDVTVLDLLESQDQVISQALADTWKGLASIHLGGSARLHSFALELDSRLQGVSYQDLLNKFAQPPSKFPQGTTTVVGFYLPDDAGRGYAESNLVLNRSSIVKDGLLISATLVFEGHSIEPAFAISNARKRLYDLLHEIGIQVVDG